MRSLLIASIVSLSATSALAGINDVQPWYLAHPASVKTLKQAVAEEHDFLRYRYQNGVYVKTSVENPYWHGAKADPKTCAALAAVKVSCDYNTRFTLTDFLQANGKGLFPEVNAWPGHERMNGYSGSAKQNRMLAEAVRRNTHLFHNGDLTATDVRTKWR